MEEEDETVTTNIEMTKES